MAKKGTTTPGLTAGEKAFLPLLREIEILMGQGAGPEKLGPLAATLQQALTTNPEIGVRQGKEGLGLLEKLQEQLKPAASTGLTDEAYAAKLKARRFGELRGIARPETGGKAFPGLGALLGLGGARKARVPGTAPNFFEAGIPERLVAQAGGKGGKALKGLARLGRGGAGPPSFGKILGLLGGAAFGTDLLMGRRHSVREEEKKYEAILNDPQAFRDMVREQAMIAELQERAEAGKLRKLSALVKADPELVQLLRAMAAGSRQPALSSREVRIGGPRLDTPDVTRQVLEMLPE